MSTLGEFTRRTTSGFGEATNESILSALGIFRQYCQDEQQYVSAILASTSTLNSHLLQFPDELLLQIADSLGNQNYSNDDLRHLALTCRQLRGAAQEALLHNGRMTLPGVRRLVRFLMRSPGR